MKYKPELKEERTFLKIVANFKYGGKLKTRIANTIYRPKTGRYKPTHLKRNLDPEIRAAPRTGMGSLSLVDLHAPRWILLLSGGSTELCKGG